MKKDISVIRDSIGRIVSMLTLQAISVTQRGSRAFVAYHPVTGAIKSLNIPYIPDDASDEFVAAVQGFLDHEVGHVLYSDPKTLIKATALGKRVANIANIIEDVYVERKMAAAFQGSGSNIDNVRSYYLNKIARPKIDAALREGNIEEARGYATVAAFRAWGGQPAAMDFIKSPEIASLVESVREKLSDDLIESIAKCESSDHCLDLAVKVKKALEASKTPPAPPPEPEPAPAPPPESEPAGDDEESEAEAEEGAADAGAEPGEGGDVTEKTEGSADHGREGERDAAEAPDDGSAGDAAPPADDDTAAEEDAGGAAGPDEEAPVPAGEEKGVESGDPDLADDPATEESDSGGGSPELEDDTADGSSEPSTEAGGPHSPELSSPSEIKPEEPEAEPDPIADMFDTECDFDKDLSESLSADAVKEIRGSEYAVFSTDFDRIEPAPLARSDKTAVALEDSLQAHIGVMQKQLERSLAAQARKSWNPGMRRGRISPGSLFKTASGDDRVFRQRFETRAKNTATSLVVDCSGSMSGSKIELAGLAAFALSTVLERLRMVHEVIGFTTGSDAEMMELMKLDAEAQGKSVYNMQWGRVEPLYMPVFKGFGEKLDLGAKSRMAHLRERPHFLSQNVDGESVQIAARRLLAQRAERHVMIVLSDGAPAAMCEHNLEGHLKGVVKDLTKKGVEVIGIGIQSSDVREYYPKHVVLHDAGELPGRVMAELTKLLLAP